MEDIGIRELTKRSLAKLRKGHPVRINSGTIPLKISSSRMKHIQRAFGRGKGHQLALNPDEITANGEGIFGKAFDKVLKKVGIKKAVYKAGDKAKPVVKEVIDKGSKALSTYAPALKPAINPLADLTKDYLDRPGYYQKNKGRNAVKALKRIGIKAGTQIARDQATDYLLPSSQGNGFRIKGTTLPPEYRGTGLYAGSGLYAGGSDARGYGMPNVGNQILPIQLRSNPYGENFLWRSTLPPEYANLHR